MAERRSGYAYETNLVAPLESAGSRYQKAMSLGHDGLRKDEQPKLSKEEVTQRVKELYSSVKLILEAQESSGAWITRDDRFKKTMPKGIRGMDSIR